MQPGDVLSTYADIDDLTRDFGFVPKTDIRVGIQRFVDWYINYYAPSLSQAKTPVFARA